MDNGSNDPPEVTATDPYSALYQWLSEQLAPDEMSRAEGLITNLLTWATEEDGWAADKRPRIAADVSTGAHTMINRETIQELQAIRQAETEVAPHVGAVLGMDSAFGVYRESLKRLGKSTQGLFGSAAAARTIFQASVRSPRRIALDGKANARRDEMFPDAKRLGSPY